MDNFWEFDEQSPKLPINQGIVNRDPILGMWMFATANYKYSHLSGTYVPYRYLPVIKPTILGYNTNHYDSVVLSAGRIVSVVDGNSYAAMFGGEYEQNAVKGFGQPYNSGGDWTYNDATTSDYDVQFEYVNDHPELYGGEGTAGAAVPCNGGNASTFYYSDYDSSSIYRFYTLKSDDGTVAESGDSMIISGNVPMGVLMYDVKADVTGRALNYQTNNLTAILSEADMVLPYIKETDASGSNAIAWFGETTDAGVQEVSAVYYALYHKGWPFVWADNGAAEAGTAFIPGYLLQSDWYGNWKFQASPTTKSIQSFGKYEYGTSNFPRAWEGMEYIDTFPGTGATGTETGGVIRYVFQFAKDALRAAHDASVIDLTDNLDSNGDPKIDTVKTYIRAGYFGLAYFHAGSV